MMNPKPHNEFGREKLSFKAGRMCWDGWFGGDEQPSRKERVRQVVQEAKKKVEADAERKLAQALEAGGKEAKRDTVKERTTFNLDLLKTNMTPFGFRQLEAVLKGKTIPLLVPDQWNIKENKAFAKADLAKQLQGVSLKEFSTDLNAALEKLEQPPLKDEEVADFIADLYTVAALNQAKADFDKQYGAFLKETEKKPSDYAVNFVATIKSGTEFEVAFKSDDPKFQSDFEQWKKKKEDASKPDAEKADEAKEKERKASVELRAETLRKSFFGRMLVLFGLMKYEKDEDGNVIVNDFKDGVTGSNGMASSIIALFGGAKFLDDPAAGDELFEGMDDKWKGKAQRALDASKKFGMSFEKLKLPGEEEGKDKAPTVKNKKMGKDSFGKLIAAKTSEQASMTEKREATVTLSELFEVPKGKVLTISFGAGDKGKLTIPKGKGVFMNGSGAVEAKDGDRVLEQDKFVFDSEVELPKGLMIGKGAYFELKEKAKPTSAI